MRLRFTEEQREQAFVAKIRIDKRSGCWLWIGSMQSGGYGQFHIGGGGRNMELAHRWAYEHWVGPIPAGMTIDHECHNRSRRCLGGVCRHRRCVNPKHLVLATRGGNTLSGKTISARNKAKRKCKYGHPLFGSNLRVLPNGDRACIECNRKSAREYQRRVRAKA